VDSAHPLDVGDDVTVGHGAILHGCTIGDASLIGIGARVLDGAQVGPQCLIAAGTVVKPRAEIPPQSLVIGVPGRIKRPLEGHEVDEILLSARRYVGYAAEYRSSAS
jgi:carbonic anhydrase/acetyltransferase-like protein (isoleucine patch superfamily)